MDPEEVGAGTAAEVEAAKACGWINGSPVRDGKFV